VAAAANTALTSLWVLLATFAANVLAAPWAGSYTRPLFSST